MGDVELGKLYVTLEGRDVGLKDMLGQARTQLGGLGQAGRQVKADLNPDAYFTAFKSGLAGIVGPAAVAGVAIGALTSTVASFKAAFDFKTQLDASTAAISAELKGFRDVNATLNESEAFARRYNLTKKETNSILNTSTDILRSSRSSVSDLEAALIRLQSRDISKPISEASRALRELSSGDVTSIKELFNVPAKDAHRMKEEILAGGDAVQVLTKWLNDAQVGMSALEQRTQGAVGKLHELEVAQENLALAQAKWAQGPGMALTKAYTNVVEDATALLSFDFSDINRQSEAKIAATQAYSQALREGKTEAEANAAAEAAREWILNSGASAATWNADATSNLGAQTQNLNTVLSEALEKHLTNTQASNDLTRAQETLASIGNQVAMGLMTAANGATAMASQYRIAEDAALALVNAQAKLAQAKLNAEALKDYRRGEHGDERTTLEFERDEHFRTLAVAAETKHQSTRVGGGQKFNNQMLGMQDKYQDDSEKLARDHERKVLDIEGDGQKRRADQERRNEVSKRSSKADFYDNLAGAEIDPTQFAQQYEQAYQKAQEIAQAGNRKLSEDYQAMRQRQIEADMRYAREAADIMADDDLTKAEKTSRLANIEDRRRLRQEAAAEEEKQLLENGDDINNEQQRQLDDENRRFQDATSEAGTRFDDLADRRIASYQRANGAIAAIPPAELTQARRTGQATGGTPETPITPDKPIKANDILAVRDDALVNAIGSQTNQLSDKLDAVRRAVEGVDRSIQGINVGGAVR